MNTKKKSKHHIIMDNDLKTIVIVFSISFFFGYLMSYFDIIPSFLNSFLTNPFWFAVSDNFAIHSTALQFYYITRGILLMVALNLLLGSLFVLPEAVLIVITGISFGTSMPYIFQNNSWLVSILYFIFSIIVIRALLTIFTFSTKIGRKVITLFIKHKLEYDFAKNTIYTIISTVTIYLIQIIMMLVK